VKKWGSQGTGNGEFSNPIAIDIGISDNVYIANLYSNIVQKFDSEGNFVKQWSLVDGPTGIALDSSGNVYAAESISTSIAKFDSDGNFITKWGSQRTVNDGINMIDGIDVDSSGNVYVVTNGKNFNVDSSGNVHRVMNENNNIQKFDSDGNFITKWGSQGTANGQFYAPSDVALDSSDNVYVADTENNRIQKFDSDGNFITKWGSQGTANGQFNFPLGIATDLSGNVYVVDSYNYRIQKFNSSGNFITKWGSQGPGILSSKVLYDGQFDFPGGIAVDSLGNVYVTDRVDNRVQVFAQDNNQSPSTTVGLGDKNATSSTMNKSKTTDKNMTMLEKIPINEKMASSTTHSNTLRKQ